MGRWRGHHASRLPRGLSAVLRGWLERAPVRDRVGRPKPAAPGVDAGAGDVEELEHELLALPAADARGRRSAPATRLGRAEAPLRAEDGRGYLDRDHEPDRAAGRV